MDRIQTPAPTFEDDKALVRWLATLDPAFAKKMEMRDWCLAIAQQGLDARGIAGIPENKARLAQAISKAMQTASHVLAQYATGDFSSHVVGGRGSNPTSFEGRGLFPRFFANIILNYQHNLSQA